MVDKETTTKDEEHAPGSAEDLEGGLSLDDLDSAIAADDPEFASSLTGIGPDDPNHVIYDEGLELEYRLEDEIKLWKEDKGFKGKLVKVLPFLPRISYHLKMKRTILRLTWQKWKAGARDTIKKSPKLIGAWFKAKLASVKKSIGAGLGIFKGYSLVKKLLFVGLIVATATTGYLVYRISTKGLLSHEEDLFIGSLAEWSQGKYIYEPAGQQEAFYESTRTSQNILLLKKMIANLRRSQTSGDTPMGAFEFYVEGTVSEVVVEIKDRESEVEDLFLRTIEDTTFDQAASGEGKRLLCDRLRKEVNKILTTGYVRRIFIKTAIIKP